MLLLLLSDHGSYQIAVLTTRVGCVRESGEKMMVVVRVWLMVVVVVLRMRVLAVLVLLMLLLVLHVSEEGCHRLSVMRVRVVRWIGVVVVMGRGAASTYRMMMSVALLQIGSSCSSRCG